MILNCLKTKEPYVGPKSDCQISPIFLQFWWVLSYIFRLLSPIFLYFWTPKVLDTLCLFYTSPQIQCDKLLKKKNRWWYDEEKNFF